MTNIFEHIDTSTNDVFKETDTTIYTNKTNIPVYLANRLIEISEDSYGGKRESNLISATSLANPIQRIIYDLERADNFYKITTDVNDIIKSTQGSILHTAYVPNEPPRQFKTILDYTISGGADYIRSTGPNGTTELRDIKTTSSLNVQKIKTEYELCPANITLADMQVKYPTLFKYVSQLSIYNWLYDLDLSVGYLDFVIMNHTARDISNTGYQIQGFEVNLASVKDTINFVTDIVTKVKAYRKSGFRPACTDLQLYDKPKPLFKLIKATDAYKPEPRAVKGSGNHASRALAAAHQASNPKFINTIVYDATKPKMDNPTCMKFCPYGRAIDNDGNIVCQQGFDIIQLKEH